MTRSPSGSGAGTRALPDGPAGLARAVADELDRRIRSGELVTWPGAAPMAAELRVARSTLTAALRLLAERGAMGKTGGRWTITEPRCQRASCFRAIIGRGLCREHYGRWQAGLDPLELPDDTASAADRTVWQPPSRRRGTAELESSPAPEREDARRTWTGLSESERVDLIAAEIRTRVESGEWATLPPAEDLPLLLRRRRALIPKALNRLAADGLVTKASTGRGPRRWRIAGNDT